MGRRDSWVLIFSCYITFIQQVRTQFYVVLLLKVLFRTTRVVTSDGSWLSIVHHIVYFSENRWSFSFDCANMTILTKPSYNVIFMNSGLHSKQNYWYHSFSLGFIPNFVYIIKEKSAFYIYNVLSCYTFN